MSHSSNGRIKVAIVGAGPAGLGAAIALSKKSHIDFAVYEKKPEISEIGNGLTIQPNTWRMLEKLGASHHLQSTDFFRPTNGHSTQHRNGRTGALISVSLTPQDTPPHQEGCRAHRSKLQNALLKEVERKRIFVGKRLVQAKQMPLGKVGIAFEDGFTDEVDLLIGADGIRSVVRQHAFPDHGIRYTGATAYRTLVRASDVAKINGLPRQVIFWHGSDGKWVYTCPLGGNDWEITCAIKEDGGEQRTSWGKQVSVKNFVDSFIEMCRPVQELLKLVTYVEQYDYFSGPRLESVVSSGSLALIGDASHPLSGAFGAGAGFALEDAYVLGEAIQWAQNGGRSIADALMLFDHVRSPHYKDLYDVLDIFAANGAELAAMALSTDDYIKEIINRNWNSRGTWMHDYKVDEVLKVVLASKSTGLARRGVSLRARI